MNQALLAAMTDWVDALLREPTVLTLARSAALTAGLLGAVSYLTYAERKVLAAMQLRKGPNVTGPLGLLQPVADGLKLLSKETIFPAGASLRLFLGAPVATFFLALAAWAVVPFDEGAAIADIHAGVLYVMAVSSLGVYGIIVAGWASNSKYALLGALRSAAQMVSYEAVMGLALVTVLIRAGSLNLTQIVEAQRQGWFVLSPLLPMAAVFFIAALAETNRVPFDLPEGESELVGGFHTEYSALGFGLFFLGEYANMILMSALTALLFFGGWLPLWPALAFVPGFVWLAAKTAACLFAFLWVRATLPRYRYDQLMRLSWKALLPFTLAWTLVVAGWTVTQ